MAYWYDPKLMQTSGQFLLLTVPWAKLAKGVKFRGLWVEKLRRVLARADKFHGQEYLVESVEDAGLILEELDWQDEDPDKANLANAVANALEPGLSQLAQKAESHLQGNPGPLEKALGGVSGYSGPVPESELERENLVEQTFLSEWADLLGQT